MAKSPEAGTLEAESPEPESREASSGVAGGLLVLGMHRSGTSALMGALERLGLRLGEPLMGAQPGNPRGYFEHLSFYRLHQEILDRFGHTWDDLRTFDPERLDPKRVEDCAAELAERVEEHFGDGLPWAIKDPRMCRLLPLWRTALKSLGSEPRYLIAFRHPDEVVASLARRDGFSRDKADLLWADHLLAAERGSRGGRRAFLAFDRLLADPLGSLDRVSQQLGLAWPRQLESAREEIDGFLESSLRHHAAPAGVPEPRGWLQDLVPSLYASVLEAQENPESLEDGGGLDAFSESAAERLDALPQALLLEHASQLHIDERRAMRHLIERGNEARQRTLEHQQREIERLRELCTSLENRLHRRTEWLKNQDELIHDLGARLERLEDGEP
ncbi:MAG: hypothetical protein AAF725_05095 [Acidobacteriota bacterium]